MKSGLLQPNQMERLAILGRILSIGYCQKNAKYRNEALMTSMRRGWASVRGLLPGQNTPALSRVTKTALNRYMSDASVVAN